MKHLTELLSAILIFALTTLFAQEPTEAYKYIGVGYYDAGHLYDTIPSPFHRDANYTPQGRYHWDTAHYRAKIRQTSAILDSLSLPIIGVWGIENEAVARDIALACREDYSFTHLTLTSLTGLDFALFYYGDRFIPERQFAGRQTMIILGEIFIHTSDHGEKIAIVLSQDRDLADDYLRDLREKFPQYRILLMGRIKEQDVKELGLSDCLARDARNGRGNIYTSRGWKMQDRIHLDTGFHQLRGGVFMRGYLIDKERSNLQKGFRKGRHSDRAVEALPIFTYFN